MSTPLFAIDPEHQTSRYRSACNLDEADHSSREIEMGPQTRLMEGPLNGWPLRKAISNAVTTHETSPDLDPMVTKSAEKNMGHHGNLVCLHFFGGKPITLVGNHGPQTIKDEFWDQVWMPLYVSFPQLMVFQIPPIHSLVAPGTQNMSW